MVKDQQEAEKQKTHSQEIQKLLEIQKVEIAKKTQEVKTDLDQVEPAVIEAQQAVKCIRKQHLVEVRSMGAPPPVIRYVPTYIFLCFSMLIALDFEQ